MGFLLGAVVGSFLNMVIYRLPRGLSFVEPKSSFCPKCNHPLGVVDLFPLLSWLSTKGKCRYCHEPVAARYFVVELITGGLFAAIWWQAFCQTFQPQVGMAVFYWLMSASLVAVIFIDWELYIIPDELNATLLVIGVGYHAWNHSLPTALKGALLGWGLLWGIALLGRVAFGKDAMGDGDIKMMRGVGALLGPTLLLANLGIAVVLGIIGGVAGLLLASQAEKAKAKSGEAEAKPEEPESLPEPLPVSFVMLAGVWYLLCLDIVGLIVPPLNRWVESRLPAEVVEEDENWAPSVTTIPFGPYLAAGALICMLFAQPIENGIAGWWKRSTGTATAARTLTGPRAVRRLGSGGVENVRAVVLRGDQVRAREGRS